MFGQLQPTQSALKTQRVMEMGRHGNEWTFKELFITDPCFFTRDVLKTFFQIPTFFNLFFYSYDSYYYFFFLGASAYLLAFIDYSDVIVLAVRGGVCPSHAAVQIAFSQSEGFPRNDWWAAFPSCCCCCCTLTVERRGLTSQHVEDAPPPADITDITE